MRFGAHVPRGNPLVEAGRRGVDVVQIFLGDPQSYRAPAPRDDAAELVASDVTVFVHAPYVMNVASPIPRIRHPGRKTLGQTCEAAAAIGAAGVIVHGGFVGEDGDPEEGFRNWRTTFDRLDTDVPVLIENTAGGDNAMARYVDAIARLWDALDGTTTPFGFCLDTCHLHAAGEDLITATGRLRDIVGRIDLLHLNDSRDTAGSGRDRHQRLGAGRVDPDALVAVVKEADAPAVVLETPGGADAHRADLDWIRTRL